MLNVRVKVMSEEDQPLRVAELNRTTRSVFEQDPQAMLEPQLGYM